MEYSFDVKMKPRYMIHFLLRHSYLTAGGITGLIISLASLAYLMVGWGSLDNRERLIIGFLASMFTVINPLMLYNRGKKQVVNNECYQEAITYRISEEGITTIQGDNSAVTPWSNVKKSVTLTEQLIVYTSPIHAFLFPYESMGQEKESIVTYIKEHIA